MNKTAWIVIVAVCVLGLGGLIVFSKKDSLNVDNIDPTNIIAGTDTSIGDRVEGDPQGKVTVFEYADYQCPGCAGAYLNSKKLQAHYDKQVAFVFRNFPLTSIHPNAYAAATVAEAAGQQGKFWEMHDMLFEHRDDWVNLSADQRGTVFKGYATQLGLNMDKFNADQAGSMVSDKIARDRALGGKVGVDSTPSFFVGSEKADDATVEDMIQNSGSKLKDMIDAALKAAGETPPARS